MARRFLLPRARRTTRIQYLCFECNTRTSDNSNNNILIYSRGERFRHKQRYKCNDSVVIIINIIIDSYKGYTVSRHPAPSANEWIMRLRSLSTSAAAHLGVLISPFIWDRNYTHAECVHFRTLVNCSLLHETCQSRILIAFIFGVQHNLIDGIVFRAHRHTQFERKFREFSHKSTWSGITMQREWHLCAECETISATAVCGCSPYYATQSD